MITPIHLSGACCGDVVYRRSESFGTIHHWAKDGASVILHEPLHVTALGLTFDHALVSDLQFASGEFTVPQPSGTLTR